MEKEQLQTILSQGAMVLAPLTKGGHLPFRRLCKEYGATITISEMAFARKLVKGDRREQALVRRHPTEDIFGVQIATNDPQEGVDAAAFARERGATFIDLNCGCPIEELARRGLGAALLRKPRVIENIARALVERSGLPVTVKLRLGWSDSSRVVPELVQQLAAAGVAAVAIHGRTREQRYTKAADWGEIGKAAEIVQIPVIGNGDILTWYEAESRRQQSAVSAVMIGRGALIKPWLFSELSARRDELLTAAERIKVYYRLTTLMKEHFGDDERGHGRIMQFLPWHFSFFHRYQPLPYERFGEEAIKHPLVQTRRMDLPEDPVDRLLSSEDEGDHLLIARELLAASDAEDAVMRIGRAVPN